MKQRLKRWLCIPSQSTIDFILQRQDRLEREWQIRADSLHARLNGLARSLTAQQDAHSEAQRKAQLAKDGLIACSSCDRVVPLYSVSGDKCAKCA